MEYTDGFVETAECRTQQATVSQYGNVVINAPTDKVSTYLVTEGLTLWNTPLVLLRQQETVSQYGNVVINALTDKVRTYSQWSRR